MRSTDCPPATATCSPCAKAPGWTYQQIADHEGVEIGTIETLLWRARQALKREFAVVSESKEALAGFLVATGALIKRTVFRAAHKAASMHSSSSGTTGGGLRNAVAGVAVTGAAVAAAFIAPHAFSGPSSPSPVVRRRHRRPAALAARHAGAPGLGERNVRVGHLGRLRLQRLRRPSRRRLGWLGRRHRRWRHDRVGPDDSTGSIVGGVSTARPV